MYPYPSGDGLHMGHAINYTAPDILTRYKKAKGFNTLQPMGWDAFGLPTEQYAIATGTHPRVVTEKNVETFRAQLQKVGFAIDWDRVLHGPPLYDVARSLFLIVEADLGPATGRFDANDRRRLGEHFLNAYGDVADLNRDELAAWRLPVLAARLTEPVPEEKDYLPEQIAEALASS